MQPLGKVCSACNVERRRKGSIKYHPQTLMPYCDNPYVCSDRHPNSPANLVARAAELGPENAQLVMLEYEQAQELYTAQLISNHPNKARAEKIRKLIVQPFTIRLGSPERAEFLTKLQEEMRFDNMTEVMRYCIDTMMESRTGFYNVHRELDEKHAHQESVKQTFAEITTDNGSSAVPDAEPDMDTDNEDFDFTV